MQSSRRKFLKTSGLLAGASLCATSLNAKEKSTIKWNKEYDVLIVGSGLSAHVSGIGVADGGLKTLMIEKMSRVGGNSVLSQQDFACVGSDLQIKAGIKDSVELFVKDLNKAGRGFNDINHSIRIAKNSNKAYEFMKSKGVKYADKLKHLGGHSVARSLSTMGGGGTAIQALHKYFLSVNGQIQRKTKVCEIIFDENKIAIGLKVKEEYEFDRTLKNDDKENKSGVVKYYKANKAIVFASGGYSRDKDFISLQNPRLALTKTPSNLGATAGALKTMLKAGAMPCQLSLGRFSFGIPTEDLIYSLMVDGVHAKRFVNEQGDRQGLSNAILENMQQNNTKKFAVIIFDKIGFSNSHDPKRMQSFMDTGKIKKFDTLEQLASFHKLPLSNLQKEVDSYNDLIKSGKDTQFKKDFSKLKGSSITKAPFYTILGAPGLSYTQGGVKTNLNFQVLNLENEPFKNLYAVGEATGGVHGYIRLTSCSIPDCTTSGLLCFEHILGA